MKLLVDMNLTPRWVPIPCGAGHEAIHWSQVGEVTAGDRTIMAWAREHRFVVLTNDLDFPQILAFTRESGPSIVLLRGEPLTPESRGEALLATLSACEQDLAPGAIATIAWDDRVRVRVLPLV